ncbi:uncharacterized protein [Physcomitrium patens]|uniref:Uncharacterized protein n=2 Tax=Physcomitrium patens TaxID=3218 RepID=A0A7I4E546_PHYPA|nr:uncharacterized protein LOC112285076 isoform X4 [Physcomitrium patens]|eukprot:XP_024381374.1 uncharacterized protein LOC112285076 isoform X4 [Physcomitrella patens]
MLKGGGVVEVSDDDDGDFEPLPLRLSQFCSWIKVAKVRPGKRKAVQASNIPNKTTPVVKASPYFVGTQSTPSKSAPSLRLQRATFESTRKKSNDNLASSSLPSQCDDAVPNPISSARSGKGAHELSSFKRNGGSAVQIAQSDNLHAQAVPDGVALSGKFHVSGPFPAHSVHAGSRLHNDNNTIVKLTARFEFEKPSSAEEKTGDTFSGNDTIEGSVGILGGPSKSSRKRQLCKAVDRVLDDSGTGQIATVRIESSNSGMGVNGGLKREGCHNTLDVDSSIQGIRGALNGNTSSKTLFEKTGGSRVKKTGKVAVREVINSTETSEIKSATYDHDDICKEEMWEEEFASFASRQSTQSSSAVQSNVTSALHALEEVASKGQILHIEKIPARPAAYTNQDFKLPKKLQKALQERGVKKFYSHQAAAMDAVFNGSSIVAATPTASGKSMTYIIPVLDSLLKVPKSRALFIFPVKALARDQLKILSDLVAEVKKGSRCYCYDGDTDMDQKAHIRKTGKIVLTNPDMLHFGILPHHKLWEQFFSNLKFVVVDEAHTYRGIFGSHVGCILRRLLRIARHYGSEPMFICCSATIANPEQHVKKLTTIDMEVIHGSGAPAGEKYVLCWLPPETKYGVRRSVYKEAVKIVVALIKADLQILVFVEARKSSEIVCKLVREKLTKQRRIDLVEKVDSYRAGYTQEERIALEKRLQDGELRALVTTRALELGIDVGKLDATVHVGLPDTMCSLWQQAGRAGRRQGASLAVILGRERSLDVFYMKNPQKLFSRDVEQAVCNPTNPHVLRLQLPCAAQELPLSGNDVEYFGENYKKTRDELVSEGILQYKTGPRGESVYGYRYDDHPGSEISIRGLSSNRFQLLAGDNEVIEEVDEKMALRMLYDGAIYPHARDTYRIKHLDIKNKKAFGELCVKPHMTEVSVKTKVQILDKMASRVTLGTRIHLGKLEVIEQVMGYSEYDLTQNKHVDTVMLKYPPTIFKTVGLWWDLPAEVMQKLKHMAYETLLVVRRVILPLLASMTMSDPTDMLGLETLGHEQTEQPQIFVYDAFAGGIGIAEQAYKVVEQAWRHALSVLKTCDCKFGCPACTMSANETVNNEANSSKHAAIVLLEYLLCARHSASTSGVKEYTLAVPKTSKDQVGKSSFEDQLLVNAPEQCSKPMMLNYGSKQGPYVSALRAASKSQILSMQFGGSKGNNLS